MSDNNHVSIGSLEWQTPFKKNDEGVFYGKNYRVRDMKADINSDIHAYLEPILSEQEAED